MIQILFPEEESRRLAFYLACEEYLAGNVSDEDMFFLWRTGPTVIYGRNQVLEDEVNLEYCRSHDVDVVRRKSGGGCVYSDEGNLMISYITGRTDVQKVFDDYLSLLCKSLSDLGFQAVASTHNDVMIGDRKVSGNAFYSLPKASIVHGTMLHSLNFSAMQQAITPSAVKLAKHAVRSVRQRVVNLTEINPEISMDELISHLTRTMRTGSRMIDGNEMIKIKEIENTYYGKL